MYLLLLVLYVVHWYTNTLINLSTITNKESPICDWKLVLYTHNQDIVSCSEIERFHVYFQPICYIMLYQKSLSKKFRSLYLEGLILGETNTEFLWFRSLFFDSNCTKNKKYKNLFYGIHFDLLSRFESFKIVYLFLVRVQFYTRLIRNWEGFSAVNSLL